MATSDPPEFFRYGHTTFFFRPLCVQCGTFRRPLEIKLLAPDRAQLQSFHLIRIGTRTSNGAAAAGQGNILAASTYADT